VIRSPTPTIAVADEFYRRLEEIVRSAPDDYRIEVGYGFTRFVRRSIREVEETVGIAFEDNVVPAVPMEAHDVWMDFIATEKGCRPRAPALRR
jgi:5-formyltetrahydrofolate cyclo-ligase